MPGEDPHGEVLAVNDTGYQIFRHCDGTHTTSDIAHHRHRHRRPGR
ncbi:PqqD family peptide modification chaperone [Nocardia blacklockiae]|nr:PqqD family peptide modification chaperone [Nocardia blacklockiae]MBF6171038.1 PqqD family peptide modification chaperone [Nocardia blacklockiae]